MKDVTIRVTCEVMHGENWNKTTTLGRAESSETGEHTHDDASAVLERLALAVRNACIKQVRHSKQMADAAEPEATTA